MLDQNLAATPRSSPTLIRSLTHGTHHASRSRRAKFPSWPQRALSSWSVRQRRKISTPCIPWPPPPYPQPSAGTRPSRRHTSAGGWICPSCCHTSASARSHPSRRHTSAGAQSHPSHRWYFLIKSVVSISIVLFSIFFLGVVYTDIAFMNNTYVLPLLLVVEEY